MRAVVQRVSRASVSAGGVITGEIGAGLAVLLGVAETDKTEDADRLADKLSRMRVFPDENGKTNLSANDVGGQMLIVSQFTLYADCKKGNRPGFSGAAQPKLAQELYEYFIKACEGRFSKTACGVFGAKMELALTNDGPFTLVLDTREL